MALEGARRLEQLTEAAEPAGAEDIARATHPLTFAAHDVKYALSPSSTGSDGGTGSIDAAWGEMVEEATEHLARIQAMVSDDVG